MRRLFMRKIEIGKEYIHFKGMIVKVICVAKNSETLEEMVVYKHIDTDEYWVRSLKMFLDDGDISDREDNVTGQKYRFELR
jgi:hypothetical protein